MKNKRIKQICIICASVFVLSATGCSPNLNEKTEISMSADSIEDADTQNAVENNESAQQTAENDTESLATSGTSIEGATQGNKKDTIEPSATKEVPIYTINETTQEVESVVALVEQDAELTPELIVELVKDSMSDRLIDIGVENVLTEGDSVIVSFFHDQPPLTDVGSGSEKTILDAIAQSLVDNLPEYPKVIFRVEGNAYESGHFIFGINQVYLDGTKTK
jgi:hypothetical protein